jgi:hypothetical protein
MIILSAAVSPAAEEVGRSEAGVLPRGNNEQRPISHKLAEGARRATSQPAALAAHLLPPTTICAMHTPRPEKGPNPGWQHFLCHSNPWAEMTTLNKLHLKNVESTC